MFSVYVLFLEQNRLYVGATKWWRLKKRWGEHCAGTGSKWTSKYAPLAKLCTYQFRTREGSKKFEHELVELLMHEYGLDSVRGGRYNMAEENTTWWVKDTMAHLSRYAGPNLSEHTCVAFLRNVPSPSVISLPPQ